MRSARGESENTGAADERRSDGADSGESVNGAGAGAANVVIAPAIRPTVGVGEFPVLSCLPRAMMPQ